MAYIQLEIHDLCLSFPHKTCFESFTTNVHFGDRIALIGDNGSGKSMLLKILQRLEDPSEGYLKHQPGISIANVPQVILDYNSLSGGERLNKTLTAALAESPEILFLDEPTNHLDVSNRKSLMKLINSYYGTVICATHDEELMQRCFTKIWHLHSGHITVFNGTYPDYRREYALRIASLQEELQSLKKEQKRVHDTLMQEQKRAKTSRLAGEKKIAQRKMLPMDLQKLKDKADRTAGKVKKDLSEKREELRQNLKNMDIPDTIIPKFSITAADIFPRTVIQIVDGEAGYKDKIILKNINLTLGGHERLAVTGNNGSGKTTLIKAIMGHPEIIRSGEWFTPQPRHIGYLDQHYSNLALDKTVLQHVQEMNIHLGHGEIRIFLNDFLFRKPEEINTPVAALSGGEKARLSLALLSLKTPKILILDEVTNNIDLNTRRHMTKVINAYPGAVLVISHDNNFLKEINIVHTVHTEELK